MQEDNFNYKKWVGSAVATLVLFYLFGLLGGRGPTAPGGKNNNQHSMTDSELHAITQTFVLPQHSKTTAKEKAYAELGEKLFHENKLSRSQKVSCATCHRPSLDFQDGKTVAVGQSQGTKNTPSIVNARYQSWFFWDGRSTNLVHQALGPLLNHAEHFSNYGQIARVVFNHYKADYEALFGPWPKDLGEEALQFDLIPAALSTLPTPPKPERPSDTVYAYFLKHLPTASQKKTLAAASTAKLQPVEFLKKNLGPAKAQQEVQRELDSWSSQRTAVSKKSFRAAEQVAINAARAIAHFEMQVVTTPTPFDAFAQRFGNSTPAEDAFGTGFGAEEFAGFKLFVGKASCMLCHMGPMFMDQSFHNIGVKKNTPETFPWDIGLLARTSALYSLPPKIQPLKMRPQDLTPYCIKEKLPKEAIDSCKTLAVLDANSLSMVGAYKTPSLRNVAKHSPHFHNGSATSLLDVVEHYNNPPKTGGVGKTEETIQPLGLNDREKRELVSFLRSLSSESRLLHRE